MADQRLEELLTGAAGGSFDHRAKGPEVIIDGGSGRQFAPAGQRVSAGLAANHFLAHRVPPEYCGPERNLFEQKTRTALCLLK